MTIVKTGKFRENYQQSYPHLVDNSSPNNYILFFVKRRPKKSNLHKERCLPVEDRKVIHIKAGGDPLCISG